MTAHQGGEARKEQDRIDRLDRMLAEQAERRYQDRKARGECRCGHPKSDCRPEICSHPFARDAMWGN